MKDDSFKQVEEFHKLANHKTFDGGRAHLPDIKVVRFREDFKIEELIEGIEALGKADNLAIERVVYLLKEAQRFWKRINLEDLDPDLVKYADSLADVKYVTDGAAHAYNMDMNKIFEEVHVKNLTRFPANEEELQATLKKAVSESIAVYSEFNTEYSRHVVKRLDNDKVFKNAMFELPDLGPIIGH